MAKIVRCPNCKYDGKGKVVTPGSILIEIVLWLMFIVPGLIYSLWRHSARKIVCPRCGNPYVEKI